MAATPKKKPKTKSSRAERAREIALYRYALIRPLADPAVSASERGKLVRELASRVHLGPFGQPVTVSRASLDPLDPGLAFGRVRRAGPSRTARRTPHRGRGVGVGRPPEVRTP